MARSAALFVAITVLIWGFTQSQDFTEIAAGVAIFLFGMTALEEGFQVLTGGTLERLLRASTNRLWKSLTFGFCTTAIVQSSSLVTLLSITFLSAGMISLAAGIGIIFGSNIGTTTGAWLIAGVGLKVDIAAYAMPMLVLGVVLSMQSDRTLRGIGFVLAGIGFVFLGIAYMKSGFDGLQSTLDLSQFAMTGFAGVLVYTLVGIVATVIMQSSHAALMIGITALAAGQITYENSLAIAIGSNIGTTVTAMIGAMKANTAGKRLALAHLIFNLVVGTLAIILIEPLRDLVDWISDAISIAPDNYTLKFAVFHTLFNVIGVALMAPLIQQLIRLLKWFVPDAIPDVSQPQFLNDVALEHPDAAVEALINEIAHLYDNAFEVMAVGLGLSGDAIRSPQSVEELALVAQPATAPDLQDLYERRVKSLHAAITEFAIKAEGTLLPDQLQGLDVLRGVARDLVSSVKDVKHINRNIRRYSQSDNTDIAEQYRQAKILIIRVLRALEALRGGETGVREEVEAIRAELTIGDPVSSDTLDGLIREKRITAEMATSLINDYRYVRDLCDKLIELALLVENNRAVEPVDTVAA